MRNLLILFISIVFVSCNQQTSNVDNAEWSGSISENDEVHSFCDGKIGSYTRQLIEILVGIQGEEIIDDLMLQY